MSEQNNGAGQVQNQSTPSLDSNNDRMAFYLQENKIEPVADGKAEIQKDLPKDTDAGEKQITEDSPPKVDGRNNEESGLPKGAQRRIDVLTKRNKTYESKLNALEAKIAELEGKTEKGKDLKRENFVNDQEYQAHLAKQSANEVLKEHLQNTQRQQEQSQQVQQFQSTWAERAQKTMTSEEMGEYREMISEGVKPEEVFSPNVLEYLEDSELGVKMMYELLKAPEVIERLNQLRPMALAVRLAELERYTQSVVSKAKSSPTQQTTQKPVTKAPDPIGQVNASGSGTSPSDDDLYNHYQKNRR